MEQHHLIERMMKLNNIEFGITEDPAFISELYNIPQELYEQLEKLNKRSSKGGEGIIESLKRLIRQYPHVPQLKNFLSSAYINTGMNERSYQVNRQILEEHPEYLYGKLNLAHEYYHKEQYERIPEVLTDMTDLRNLCPGRDQFHITEVSAFLGTVIMYFCAIGNLKAAEQRYEILEELAPENPDTEQAQCHISTARLKSFSDDLIRDREERIEVIPLLPEPVPQKEVPPEFNHNEIGWLYENDLSIEPEKLRTILALPGRSLIDDLKKVLQDSVERFDYYTGLADETDWVEEEMNFPVHAIFLLGELRATECLGQVLDTLRRGARYTDFWFGDIMASILWEPVYYLGAEQLEELKAFVLTPGTDSTVRSVICHAVIQVAHHQPIRKKELTGWFEELFTTLAGSESEENIVDSYFTAYAIIDAAELGEPGLLPAIKALYDRNYVSQMICGDFDDVTELFKTRANGRKLMNIYDRYREIIATWPGYNMDMDEEEETDEEFWPDSDKVKGSVTSHDPQMSKVGRNDPCPCGSGKKYKKCCWSV